MTTPNDTGIPEEILRSEQKQPTPVRGATPGILGLPGLPPAILDLVVQYGPTVVLAAAAYGGFNAMSTFILLSSPDTSPSNPLLPFIAFLGLAAAVVMGLSYVWLTQKRRTGWNMLAIALIIQFLSQILTTGVSSILYAGFGVLITMYVMLQLRDSYSA